MTTKEWFNILKWVIALAIVVLLFVFFRGCGKGAGSNVIRDTISVQTVKTVEVIKTDTSYIPVPYKVVQYVSKFKTDTLESFEVIRDTLKAIKDYLATRYYRDTLDLKDSAGYIVLMDTISRNKAIGRGIQASINKTTVTTTITVPAPKRVTLYVGINAVGNKENTIYAVGGSFGIMAKNGKYYGAIVQLTKSGQPMYGAQILLPIRLRK